MQLTLTFLGVIHTNIDYIANVYVLVIACAFFTRHMVWHTHGLQELLYQEIESANQRDLNKANAICQSARCGESNGDVPPP